MGISLSRSAALLLVLVFLIASLIMAAKPVSAATPDSWTSKAPMQVARSGLGVAVVNGKIYAIGGSTAAGTLKHPTGGVVGTNEKYDPAMDIWTYKKSMPTPRQVFAIANYQNKIYCIGGYTSDGNVTGINEVYDPETDTWESKAPMPTARVSLEANVANGKIYLIGGYVPDNSSFGYSISNLTEVYDPSTDSWITKAPMPTAASDYASAVVDNRIFVIGGQSGIPHSNLNQIYDPITDGWSTGAPSPSGIRYGFCAAGATTGVNAPKRIYVLGETAHLWEDEPPNSVRIYYPKSDVWAFGADIPTKRHSFAVAVVNDILYVIGGFTEIYTEPLNWYSSLRTVYAANEQYTPFGYGTPDPSYDGTAPEITVASPENKTYYTTDVALNFTVNEPVSSMHYKLDGETFEISGNTTLTGLSYGMHNLTVHATDAADNTGSSEVITFTVAEEPEPFPAAPVAAASVATIAVVGVGLLVYFRRRKH